MGVKRILVLLLLLMLTGCDLLNPECRVDTGCQTPFEYLARSSCPFGSASVEGGCEVVCAYWDNVPDNTILPKPCVVDTDCSCMDSPEVLDCICHDGSCLSVMDTSSVLS